MTRVRELAINLYGNEIAQFTPIGAPLFCDVALVKKYYKDLTDEKIHFWHKVWLFRAAKLLEKARTDLALEAKINTFMAMDSKDDWINIGFDIYRVSKSDYPEVTSEMVKDIDCCPGVVTDGK